MAPEVGGFCVGARGRRVSVSYGLGAVVSLAFARWVRAGRSVVFEGWVRVCLGAVGDWFGLASGLGGGGVGGECGRGTQPSSLAFGGWRGRMSF